MLRPESRREAELAEILNEPVTDVEPTSEAPAQESGDQLIRIYKSKLIEVDVLDDGYKWNGEVYPTLTHISWEATGYQIGGNNFFGLPTKRRGE